MPLTIDMNQDHPIITTGKTKVADCVRAAGFNDDSWNKPGSFKHKNFEWAQCEQHNNLYLFNLWFYEITKQDGDIVCKANWRTVHEQSKQNGMWKHQYKSDRTDRYACAAHHRQSPVRVVVVDGHSKPDGSRVATARNLDPVVWRVDHYDMTTGSAHFRRERA